MDPRTKLEHLSRWIEETKAAAAGQGPRDSSWMWIVLLFRIEALLDPGGSLRTELDALFGLACALGKDEELARRLQALPGRPREALLDDLGVRPERARKGLTERALAQGANAEGALPPVALAKALYTPLDLLAHHDVPPALAGLLELPLRATDPAFFGAPAPDAAAAEAAIAAASKAYPSLRLDAQRFDYSSPLAFAVGFNGELQAQVLDPKAKPAPARKKGKAAPEPEWKALEGQIVVGARRAIARWAKEKKVPMRAFVLEVDPPAGYVLFSVETAQHHREVRQGLEREAAKAREKALTGKQAWRKAQDYLRPHLEESLDPGDFAAQDFDSVDFGAQLDEFMESPSCPPTPAGDEADSYVDAQVRLTLWRAIEALVAEDAFAAVLGDEPLAVGYAFHEEPTAVLRIVERAAAKGRRTR